MNLKNRISIWYKVETQKTFQMQSLISKVGLHKNAVMMFMSAMPQTNVSKTPLLKFSKWKQSMAGQHLKTATTSDVRIMTSYNNNKKNIKLF